MRGTIYALALPLSTLLYQFRKFTPTFLQSAAREVSGHAWGQPLLTRAVLLKQQSKTRVFETPASANAKARRCQLAGLSRVMSSPPLKDIPANSAAFSPELFYEPVHNTRVNQLAAAARRPR